MKHIKKLFLFSCLITSFLFSQDISLQIDEKIAVFDDLEKLQKVNEEINDKLPFLYNYLYQGGYFVMPSAKMPESGTIAVGYSSVPPYKIISGSYQFYRHLELSGNYIVYSGITEGNIGDMGFGDDADRTANIKVSFLQREDGVPFLPEISVGVNDCLGSQRFQSVYFVATQDFLDYDLELTVGWGKGRMKGFFGGLAWSPFRKFKNALQGITLAAEYDCNNYKHHGPEHPYGRDVKYPINVGLHYRLFDVLYFSASTIRGKKIAASASINYNLGNSKGFFPKFNNPLYYNSPVNLHPLDSKRSEESFAQELAYALKDQGFSLFSLILSTDENNKRNLHITVVNMSYRNEEIARERIQYILGSLLPNDIEKATVIVEADALPVYQYTFHKECLRKFIQNKIGKYELSVISPMANVESTPGSYDSELLYKKRKRIWTFTARPTFRTYFGGSKGKFKYDVGFVAGPEGYLFNHLFYDFKASYTIKDGSADIGDRDFYFPSQIINVRTDFVNYHKSSSFHIDNAYIQKSWNMRKGWFSRLAFGYFELAYAGLAGEVLYFPTDSSWAVGVEAASVLKRNYHGIGFSKKIRKFNGTIPEYLDYWGLQYFIDFYYDIYPLDLGFKASVGQFLAKDKGVKLECIRYFKSGLRLSFWYTFTNGGDKIHGRTYFDKGIGFSVPLDMFLNKSSRTRIGYSMSAWLRDVGAKACTGKELYPIIYNARQSFD